VKFDSDLHRQPRNAVKQWFRENRCSGRRTVFKSLNEILPYFLQFLSDFDKFEGGVHKTTEQQSAKTGLVNVILYLRA
jgi:hypothetical protein